jgi:hypothetical protein
MKTLVATVLVFCAMLLILSQGKPVTVHACADPGAFVQQESLPEAWGCLPN